MVVGVRPLVDCGRYPAKATVGVPLEVTATLVTDGTSLIHGWAWQGPASTAPSARDTAPPKGWEEVPLEAAGQDRFTAWTTPAATGPAAFCLVGVIDDYGTWLRDLRIRIEAGQEVGPDLSEGAELVARRASLDGVSAADRAALQALRNVGETDKSVLQLHHREAAGRNPGECGFDPPFAAIGLPHGVAASRVIDGHARPLRLVD